MTPKAAITVIKAVLIICCTPLALVAWLLAIVAATPLGPFACGVVAIAPVLFVSWRLNRRGRRRR